MGFVNLECPTCKGTGQVTILYNFDHTKCAQITRCIPCSGTGAILVHANSITGQKATRVITDDPWNVVWNQLDLFESETDRET